MTCVIELSAPLFFVYSGPSDEGVEVRIILIKTTLAGKRGGAISKVASSLSLHAGNWPADPGSGSGRSSDEI